MTMFWGVHTIWSHNANFPNLSKILRANWHLKAGSTVYILDNDIPMNRFMMV